MEGARVSNVRRKGNGCGNRSFTLLYIAIGKPNKKERGGHINCEASSNDRMLTNEVVSGPAINQRVGCMTEVAQVDG